MWGRRRRGNNATCSALSWLLVTSSTTHKQIGPFWCWFLDGWVCVHSRTLWVFPVNTPVRPGVSFTTATPTSFYHQRFWSCISPCWNLGLHSLSHFPVVLPTTRKCGTTHPGPRCCLAAHPLHPVCLSLPLLPVWMNASSLTPWLSDFHTVWFSGSSGYLLFLNLFLSFFRLFKEQSVSTYASILTGSLSKWF